MSMFPQSNTRPVELEYGTDDKAVFNFFNAVYGWMAVALAVTATVGFLVSQSPELLKIIYGQGKMGFLLVGLGTWALAYASQKVALEVSANLGTVLFMAYAAILGVLLSGIFIVYTAPTLIAAFLLTAGTFGAMSIYGFVTKRDLTTIGSYLVMAAFGLFFATIINIFIASNALSWVITYAVLFVFIGLVAYETQKLRNIAVEYGTNGTMASRYAVVGSIMLYISFINIFISILRIIGNRK